MKTPLQKYKDAVEKASEKLLQIQSVCEHPKEYLSVDESCDEDEYGRTIYNRGTTTYRCGYCGKWWSEDWST